MCPKIQMGGGKNDCGQGSKGGGIKFWNFFRGGGIFFHNLSTTVVNVCQCSVSNGVSAKSVTAKVN